MESRRRNKAKDLGKVIRAGFGSEANRNLILDTDTADRLFSGIIRIGNATIQGKS